MYRESQPFEWFYNCFFFIPYSFGAMPRSILAKMAIWDPNLKIGLCTTLIKVKVLDTYGVIASSPKQFDLDRSKVKVTEMAHWVLKLNAVCF